MYHPVPGTFGITSPNVVSFLKSKMVPSTGASSPVGMRDSSTGV